VVATLWPVGDAAIAGLPQRFHTRLRSGVSPAEALRRAQLDLLSNRSAPRPFAWAPFQLYWVGIDPRGGNPWESPSHSPA
jgi:CHAT domain-containing protein